jgi:hypothetical protein
VGPSRQEKNEKEKEKEGAGWLGRRRIVLPRGATRTRGALMAGWAEPAGSVWRPETIFFLFRIYL